MAFPTLESQQTSADSTSGGAAVSGSTAATSHSVTLPTPITAGALLVVLGRVAGVGAVAVTGGGWTIVQDSSDASDDVTFWMYRDTLAAGTEDGTTITVTHGNFKMCAVSLSITGAADPATRAPETSTVAVAATTTVNPTTCTPTGGAKDYLWLWFGAWDGEQTVNKTAATNYTTGDVDVSTSTGGLPATNVQLKFGCRQLNAASEDPGACGTLSAAPTGWTAWTIAVHPPPAAQTGTPLVASVAVAGIDATASNVAGTQTGTPAAATVATSGVNAAASGSGTATSTALTASVTTTSINAAASGSGTGTATPAIATVATTSIAAAASPTGSAPVTPETATVTISAVVVTAENQGAGATSFVAGGAVPGITSPNPVNWDWSVNRGSVLWWLALPDQQRGLYWRDLVGLSGGLRGYDGVLTNMDPPTDWVGPRGRPGGWGSLDFDGNNNDCITGTVQRLDFPITMSCWVRADAVTGGVLASHDSNVNVGYRMEFNGSGILEFVLGAIGTYVFTTLTCSANEWTFVAVTVTGNGGTATGYLGFDYLTSEALTIGTMVGSPNRFHAGNRGGGVTSLDGVIDDVRFFNRVLAPDEVEKLFRESKAGYPNGLRWEDFLAGGFSGVDTTQTGTPGNATVTITGHAATAAGTSSAPATPGTATVTVSGVAATASGTATATATPGAATVTVSAHTVAATSGGAIATPGTASVSVTGQVAAASPTGSASVIPQTATVTVSGIDATSSATGTATAVPLVATVSVTTVVIVLSGTPVQVRYISPLVRSYSPAFATVRLITPLVRSYSAVISKEREPVTTCPPIAPGETRLFKWTFSLAVGETINSGSTTVTAVQNCSLSGSKTVNGGVVTQLIAVAAGATLGAIAQVRCRMVTSSGRSLDKTIQAVIVKSYKDAGEIDPDEIDDLTWLMSASLAEHGTTISSIAVAVDSGDVTLGAPTNTTTTGTVRLSAPTLGVDQVVRAEFTLANGEVVREYANLETVSA